MRVEKESKRAMDTHSLTSGDLEDLSGEADGALDTKLLVLSTVDQVRGDWKGVKNNTCIIMV